MAAASRRSLGTAVFGGMIAATFLAVIFVPVFFVVIRRLTEGRTLLIVEHDMSVVFGLADRISVLVYGQIIASGTPEEIRGNPKVKEAYLGEEAA